MTTIQPILLTSDLPGMLAFYRGLLDAEETQRYPAEGAPFFVGLRAGAAEFGLVNDEKAPAAPGPVLLGIDVDDVRARLGRVEALGGTVLGPPNDMPWGQRVAHIQDPDGNAVNLTQSVPPA
ncbi:VOC family protein [Pseudonocardia kujensis]|uniref:VOC family protein n=1 Tax=Pseudonocardia kujensis TaxID=1128675 RepID=UPI001E43B0F4|nr:VOC family protein [Pseudonocardia kujensis]MCE0767875.1 VOC family protein [Pseudonocardia kujensis]